MSEMKERVHRLCVRLAAKGIHSFHSASPFPKSEQDEITAAFEPTFERLVDFVVDVGRIGVTQMIHQSNCLCDRCKARKILAELERE